MKILVTGVAGFIGSHLAERLAELGHEVVGIDCFTDYYARALKELNAGDVRSKGVEFLDLDLATDALGTAVAGVQMVYHLAAQPGNDARVPFETYVRNNLIATHRLVEAAKGVPSLACFVHISTSSVYGLRAAESEEAAPKPVSYYGVTKLAAEQLVMAYQREGELPACVLRLFSVYGERERPEKLYPKLIHSILAGTEFPLFEGSEEHSRSFTYVADVVDGCVAVLNNTKTGIGEIFNIGSDIETSTGEGIRIVEAIMGKKAEFAGRPRRPGDQLRTHANIAKARKLLGYDPRVPPEEGLKAEVAWYEDRVFGKIPI